MNFRPDIDIIGTGNVAWHLSVALDNNGYAVRNVYDRDIKKAEDLASHLYEGEATESLDLSKTNSSLVIIAVSDDAIEEVSRELILPDGITVVHTSGSSSMDVLAFTASNHIGVFYPLQTLTRERKISFKSVPILVEGSDRNTENMLRSLASSISRRVEVVNSTRRKLIHLAAVIASNFPMNLMIHAQSLLEKEGIDFGILQPLIRETTEKCLELGPQAALTGPAKRGDLQVLDEHIALLDASPRLNEIYRLISQDILDRNLSP